MLDVVSAAKIIDNHIKYQTITLGSICMTSVSPWHGPDFPRYILDIMSNLRVIMVMTPLNTLSGNKLTLLRHPSTQHPGSWRHGKYQNMLKNYKEIFLALLGAQDVTISVWS